MEKPPSSEASEAGSTSSTSTITANTCKRPRVSTKASEATSRNPHESVKRVRRGQFQTIFATPTVDPAILEISKEDLSLKRDSILRDMAHLKHVVSLEGNKALTLLGKENVKTYARVLAIQQGFLAAVTRAAAKPRMVSSISGVAQAYINTTGCGNLLPMHITSNSLAESSNVSALGADQTDATEASLIVPGKGPRPRIRSHVECQPEGWPTEPYSDTIVTVMDAWEEWKEGFCGWPAIQDLDAHYGRLWRWKPDIDRWYRDRSRLIHYIEWRLFWTDQDPDAKAEGARTFLNRIIEQMTLDKQRKSLVWLSRKYWPTIPWYYKALMGLPDDD